MSDAFCIIPAHKSEDASYSTNSKCNVFIVKRFYAFNVRIIKLLFSYSTVQNKRIFRKRYTHRCIHIRKDNG